MLIFTEIRLQQEESRSLASLAAAWHWRFPLRTRTWRALLIPILVCLHHPHTLHIVKFLMLSFPLLLGILMLVEVSLTKNSLGTSYDLKHVNVGSEQSYDHLLIVTTQQL